MKRALTRRLARGRKREGVALLATLLVLLALFVLCAPFLATVGNADASSVRLADQASARIALDSASRRARGRLAGSHVAIDRTPYYDDLSELTIDNLFPPGFDDASDANGVMWDVEAEDLSARIDLGSAPPQVLGNLLGGLSWLAETLTKDASSMKLTGFTGFGPEGFVWVGKELVGYTELDGNQLKRAVRGIAAVEPNEDGKRDPCGPQPAYEHPRGTLVIDQRLLAIPTWRMVTPDASFRTFSTIEEVLDAERFVMAEKLPLPDILALRRAGSVYGDVRGGPRWTRAVRVADAITAGEESCRLRVDEARFFNAGTTIRITDGQTTEYGIVRDQRNGELVLHEQLVNDYPAYTAEIQALVRRPVNLNTASLEVLRALFLNLKLRGSTDRITTGEAERLVEEVVALRPFDGHEDFLERLVLPAAGLDVPKDDTTGAARTAGGGSEQNAGFIDPADAVALYKNGLNANDYELEFSTMPFCFTSRDVFGLELRASINAPSGVERVARSRSEVQLIVPQVQLMTLFARQKDFDDAQLIARNAPGWVTGPVPTRRFDVASKSPTEARAHLGPYDRAFESVAVAGGGSQPFYAAPTSAAREAWVEPPPATLSLPSRDDAVAWTQVGPARLDEANTGDGTGWIRAGKLMHFDAETRSLEGHFLPDEAYAFAPDDPMLDWVDENGLARPVHGSLWIQPRSLAGGETFFDLAGSISDADRVTLLVEDGDLVLRVHDGGGDHPDTVFQEVGEVRYPLAGEGPGLPLDTWSHIEFDVRGNRPDQMSLLVDGMWRNETPGLTRLTTGIGPSDRAIAVESTDGFPDRCVLRIGEELIEAVKTGSGGFTAIYSSTGADAGFGGRAARERFSVVGDAPANLGVVSKARTYATGTPVTLYGYSLRLPDDHWVPVQTSTLASDLGPFSVLYATGILRNGEPEYGPQMEAITIQIGVPPVPITLGFGMRYETEATGLVLESSDPARPTAEAMTTFSPNGGYAVLVGPGGPGTVENTSDGNALGYLEVVHYSGWSDNQLAIDRRGDDVAAELGLVDENDQNFGFKAAWIVEWNASLFTFDPNESIANRLQVFPISTPAPGADMTPGIGFLPATVGDSQFAQYTRLGSDAAQTEWVRYDTIVGGQLVRMHPDALRRARFAARGGGIEFEEDPVPPGGGINPGTQGPGGGGGKSGKVSVSATAPTPAPQSAAQSADGSTWSFEWGEAEDTDLFVTRAVSSYFQFRGVLGTFSHTHPAGTIVQPVFQMANEQMTGGWPGRFDAVMLMESSLGGGGTAPGWPGSVHRAVRPTAPLVLYGFDLGAGPLATVEAETDWLGDVPDIQFDEQPTSVPDVYDQNVTYVALERAPTFPVGSAGGLPFEQRSLARLAKFPSGERPRVVAEARLGGAVVGQGNVPAALVDEVAWGWSRFGGLDATAGSQMALATDLDEAGTTFFVQSKTYRIAGGDTGINNQDVLGDVPADAGVLRMGDELMIYNLADAGTGSVSIASGGRGVLGTLPQPHAAGETITFLDSIRVSLLVGGLSPDSSEIPVSSVDGFPAEGTLLIEDELIHYTRVRGDTLEMPRLSTVAGMKDGRGAGIFRGRFGTFPRDHAAGVPVIVFPFRFWDRWRDGADAPELFYQELSVDQPKAFWRSAFFDVEETSVGGSRLMLLARTDPDAPWDAQPFETRGLTRFERGMPEGEGNPLGVSSDRLDLRFYVEYLPGAFDPVDGLSHGWKTTPRLRMVGAEYVAPNLVLRRIER